MITMHAHPRQTDRRTNIMAIAGLCLPAESAAISDQRYGWERVLSEEAVRSTTQSLNCFATYDLHWLRAPQRIEFLLAVLVYRLLHGMVPSHLADELHWVADLDSRRRLRSASTSALVIPPMPCTMIGDRTFWSRLRKSGTAYRRVCSLLHHFQSFVVLGNQHCIFTRSFPTGEVLLTVCKVSTNSFLFCATIINIFVFDWLIEERKHQGPCT